MSNLNFPFYLYPGAPFSGYYNIKLYLSELERLCETIDELSKIINTSHFSSNELFNDFDITKSTILHISIGAPIEEKYNGNHNEIKYQYQQLFPFHLSNIYMTTDYNIVHFIIAPNNNLCDEMYIDPSFFVMNDSEIQIKKIKNRYYKSNDNRYRIIIFCTMMPHLDKRNSAYITKLKEKDIMTVFNVDQLIQTSFDIDFIKYFYGILSDLFDINENKNGFVTCFSFAVFHQTSKNIGIANYQMFSEIISLFMNDQKHRILAEWTFTNTCYTLYKYKTEQLISYIKPTCEMPHGNQIIIDENNLVLVSNKMFINPEYQHLMSIFDKNKKNQQNQRNQQNFIDINNIRTDIKPHNYDHNIININLKCFYSSKLICNENLFVNLDRDATNLFTIFERCLNMSGNREDHMEESKIKKMITNFIKYNLTSNEFDEYLNVDQELRLLMRTNGDNLNAYCELLNKNLDKDIFSGGVIELLVFSKLSNLIIGILINGGIYYCYDFKVREAKFDEITNVYFQNSYKTQNLLNQLSQKKIVEQICHFGYSNYIAYIYFSGKYFYFLDLVKLNEINNDFGFQIC